MTTNVDSSTNYLGLELKCPVISSASPLNAHVDKLRAIEAAGAGAVVLPSLFAEEAEDEELEAAGLLDSGDEFAEFASSPLVEVDQGDQGTNRHVLLVQQAKQALTIPVIASVNGSHPGNWSGYAGMLARAGADAIELNLYNVAADPGQSPEAVEDDYLTIITDVKKAIGDLPLAVKVSPFISSVAHFAPRALQAGARAVVLFNRFYGPDLDLEALSVHPTLALSTSAELPLRLRWAGILSAQVPDLQIAITGGVHSGADVIKSLLVGATVACTTSAVLSRGPAEISQMVADMRQWLASHDYESVDQLRGSMNASSVDDPEAFERAQYMQILHSWN
ncbi:Genome sequencing data, contig C257 [Propionibacterium freudenreichii]|nr:Genome sequencing data, contig C257 [Propionibacterium freudenreichii]SCQ80169.1 Genome sequencing data, contig C257 [Propionibacterium freudenreichii]